MKPTIYQTITTQIVAAIEEGASAYKMPWHRSCGDIASPRNAVNGSAYRGVNILSLWATATARGFGSGVWATYRQWQDAGAQVRKGEKAVAVVFWKRLTGDAEADLVSQAERRAAFVARAFNVFNAEQVEGYTPPALPVLPEAARIARAEAFFANIPARIEQDGASACYVPSLDTVRMPPFARFTSATGYYATLAHELTHWTGAPDRLARDLSGRFGSEAYAMEELVAELGAAFVAGQLGLASTPRTDHAPYIASWLKVLKGDSRAIFTAAGKAQAAADFLTAFAETAPAATAAQAAA